MTPLRAPQLPLRELEEILGDIARTLAELAQTATVRALDARIAQCETAIAACVRHAFSPPLIRALSAKVLELETDSLVLRREQRTRSAGRRGRQSARTD